MAARSTTDHATTSAEQHTLVLDHLSLATRLARRFRGRGVDLDDLEQVARLGLVKAAAGFDADRGAFAAFATATISGELKKHFRDRAWVVRPPRRLQDLQARISAEQATDVSSGDVASLASRLGVDEHEVTEAAAARGCFTPDSLDSALDVGQERGALDERLELVDEWVTFCHLCEDLGHDDRELLQWRFVDDLTQQQIADRLGISQMQVSRRLSSLLQRLRDAAGELHEAA